MKHIEIGKELSKLSNSEIKQIIEKIESWAVVVKITRIKQISKFFKVTKIRVITYSETYIITQKFNW